jgi:hypothetical protein
MRKLLGKLLLFGVLEMGALCGVPMSPDQIEKLMEVMTRVKVVHVIKKERDRDPRKRLESRR